MVRITAEFSSVDLLEIFQKWIRERGFQLMNVSFINPVDVSTEWTLGQVSGIHDSDWLSLSPQPIRNMIPRSQLTIAITQKVYDIDSFQKKNKMV